MYRLKKLLSVSTLAMTLGAAALAGPAQGADGVLPYDPYGSAGPTLVPEGVGVFERRGSRITLDAIDATTGRRTTLARARLDHRVDLESDDSDANAATSATHSVVAFASEGVTPRGGTGLRLGGTVQAGPLGGPHTILHSCAGETRPAPIALDASLMAAAERTTCSTRRYGVTARFDVVARDLSAGAAPTTLARDVIVGNDLIAVAGPYVAFAAAPTDDPDGYGHLDYATDLRVYDARSGAQVTAIQLEDPRAIASLDVLSNGRVVACSGTRVAYADPGKTRMRRTGARCRRIQGLPDGRVAVEHERQIDVVDLATGQPTVLLRMGAPRLVPFETDGTRIAWQDVSCRSVVARVARLDQLGPAAASVPELDCPVRLSRNIDVNVRRRSASVTVTCPKGCAGPLYLVAPGRDFLSELDIDPVPGRATRLTFRLDRAAARHIQRIDINPRIYAAAETLASPQLDYQKVRVRLRSR